MQKFLFSLLLFVVAVGSFAGSSAQAPEVKIARMKYRGGGDWYANVTSLPNLIEYANKQLGTNLVANEATVEAGAADIFQYPFVHATGHGNIVFSSQEAENLRNYCLGGGFLHFDDNYGMDKFIRSEIKKIFPDKQLVELPFSHPVYHQKYDFGGGLPKTHQHDGKPPQGFGIIHEGRVVLFYSYESDLGNGWEDSEVHNDPIEKHIAALKMGCNLLQYAFTH